MDSDIYDADDEDLFSDRLSDKRKAAKPALTDSQRIALESLLKRMPDSMGIIEFYEVMNEMLHIKRQALEINKSKGMD